MSTSDTDSNSYKPAFIVIPSNIWDLEGITLSFLRIYETIFQFWHRGKKCFLTNEAIMERTGVKSESTIKEAFVFFEKHNVLKRMNNEKTGQRFLVQPSLYVEIESESAPVDNPAGESAPPRRRIGSPPPENRPHNINNNNIMNINKSFCREDQKKNNQKKHDWGESQPHGLKQTAKFWGPGHPDWERLNLGKVLDGS